MTNVKYMLFSLIPSQMTNYIADLAILGSYSWTGGMFLPQIQLTFFMNLKQ